MSDPEPDRSSESEYEDMTPAEIYTQLKTAWINEKTSPEILLNDESITESAQILIESMESNLKRSRNVSLDGIGVKTSLHSLEVDRVKFVLTAYIRERIQKIEKRPSYYLQNPAYSELLSESEREFATRLVNISKDHIQSEVYNRVEVWRGDIPRLADDMAKWGKQFADDHYVCVKFLTDYLFDEDIDLEENERSFSAGDQLIIRWKYCKKPIATGSVALI